MTVFSVNMAELQGEAQGAAFAWGYGMITRM
jgi:hypothetical protein